MVLEHKTYELFGKVLFEKVAIVPPFRKPTSMPDEACFLHVLGGEVTTYSATSQLQVIARESVLMKCGEYMSEMFASRDPKNYEAIAVHFYPEILKKIYERDIPEFLKKPAIRTGDLTKVPDDLLLTRYIDSVLFYFENPEFVSEQLLILKLKELILLLSKTRNAPVVHEILSSLFSPNTFSFKEVIEAHLYTNLSQDDLARLANLSLSSFKREFRRIYNDSPANYIRSKKLDLAADLLKVAGKRIADVAFESGFNSLAHFSKCFHEKFHLSPSEFRLNQKENTLT